MKEFIEKLIGRLEELKELHAELIKDGLEEDYHSGCEGMCVDIIEIVTQLAEEYNNDFCVWKNGTSSVFPIKTNCGNSIDVNYGYEFCPYCGKKIKVAPYTEGE